MGRGRSLWQYSTMVRQAAALLHCCSRKPGSMSVADFLNDRGWIVAFPQRRGRGKSDGLYDEGFSADRRQGYTCDFDTSLLGAERALDDIAAAMLALRQRPDVAPSRVLIGGISRGGILSVAYAGMHPDQISGVINF